MDNTVSVALISAGSSGLVAITALILSYRGFSSIDARFSSLDARFASLESRMLATESRFDSRFAAIERRLDAFSRT